jgi:hypothetical protein
MLVKALTTGNPRAPMAARRKFSIFSRFSVRFGLPRRTPADKIPACRFSRVR